MIKLETKAAAPSAVSTLEIKSGANASSVVLSTDEVREAVEVGGKTEWQTSKLKRKQLLTFIGSDGVACSLEGTVLESEAIEIAAAHKVVVQIQIANELKAAFSAGRVSKAYTSLELARVVEVWDTPTNCLWKAAASTLPASAPSFDPATGKVSRAAA